MRHTPIQYKLHSILINIRHALLLFIPPRRLPPKRPRPFTVQMWSKSHRLAFPASFLLRSLHASDTLDPMTNEATAFPMALSPLWRLVLPLSILINRSARLRSGKICGRKQLRNEGHHPFAPFRGNPRRHCTRPPFLLPAPLRSLAAQTLSQYRPWLLDMTDSRLRTLLPSPIPSREPLPLDQVLIFRYSPDVSHLRHRHSHRNRVVHHPRSSRDLHHDRYDHHHLQREGPPHYPLRCPSPSSSRPSFPAWSQGALHYQHHQHRKNQAYEGTLH